MQLQIRHIENPIGKTQFEVVYMSNGKHSETICLTPPGEVIVEPHNTNLQNGLKWYLEEYLDLPIETFQTRAEEIQESLRSWGKETFKALFDKGLARDWYQEGRRKGLTSLEIKVSSDNPAILAWPWEVLESEDDGCLALHCHMERQLCKIADARPPTDTLPKDRLNILYIIARPYGDNDVGFQTLAKPLIDFAFAMNESWPVHIDLLRPPTFDQLRAVLREKPGFYHIVHFDGHGGYGYRDTRNGLNTMNDKFSGSEGVLVFENETGEEDPISAEMLGELLSEHNIPAMVLNACQSAMVDERDKTPFASVAASLIKAGINSVVAMSYSLWVGGAKEFLPGFYRQLFRDGSIARAVRSGREEMYRNNVRDSVIGKVIFYDWIVPVLYQQLPSGNTILPKLTPNEDRIVNLPQEALELDNYGFIGRDRAILRLEQAVQRQPQAGILIHGMSGEGKTTLAKGFLKWLEATNGLGSGAFWFSFENIHSADYVLDTLANMFSDIHALTLSQKEKISVVARKLKAERFFLVWDNFESASEIPGTEVSGLIPEEGRQMLKRLLHELRGGRTKILITSRSSEDWLTVQDCFRLPLGGLQGEELWQYCNTVVADLGLTLDRNNDNYRYLLNKLDGNPLALRAVLLRLKERDAAALAAELEKNFNGLQGDEATKRIQAALAVFECGLDRAFSPVLRLLGLHEHSANTKLIEIMLNQMKSEAETHVGDCFAALESAGLCRPIAGATIYNLHPALHSCLTRLYPAEEADRRFFAESMSNVVYIYTPKELYEKREVFSYFGANFRHALGIARELDMREAVLLIMEGLATYAQDIRFFMEADRLFKELVITAQNYGNIEMEAVAYHRLGSIAEKKRDFSAAKEWYGKSLAIEKNLGNDYHMAHNYHQLGMIAQEQHDFTAAGEWYTKALEIWNKLGDDYHMAHTYHQLGIVAEKQRDFSNAEEWYRKSLDIRLKISDEYGMAFSFNQLGVVAQERRDYPASENWFRKALEVWKKRGDEYHTAITCHGLGMVAQKRGDFSAAEDWCKKALEINLKLNDEHGMAYIYHQLGTIAQEQGEFTAAENWYGKSLEIWYRLGDEYGIAGIYHQLGIITQGQHDFTAAGEWYIKALEIWNRLGDEHGMASTRYQLGRLAEERGDLAAAEDWYKKSLEIRLKLDDGYYIASIYHGLGRIAQEQGDFIAAEEWYKKALAIIERFGYEDYVGLIQESLDSLQALKGDNPAR